MSDVTLDNDAPRYRQILEILRSRVEAGQYPLETSMPSESELCAEFDASRYTIREALRRLVDQGMVVRRQGSGSVVVASRPQGRYVHSVSSVDDLFQYALDTHYEILSIEAVKLPRARAELVAGEAGSSWTLVKGIRRTQPDGAVVSFTHSYIPERLSRFTKDLPSCVGPFYAFLSRKSREEIIEVDQEIYGAVGTAETARHLGGSRGDPLICAMRRYTGTRGTIISSINWHIAASFKYRMKLYRKF